MDSDDYTVLVTILAIAAIIATIVLGVTVHNRNTDLDAANATMAAYQNQVQAARVDMIKANKESAMLLSVAESLDPTMLAKLSAAINGDISKMSVADALAMKAKIEKKIAELDAIRIRYAKALSQLGDELHGK